MPEPNVAQDRPFVMEIDPATYAGYACRHSENQTSCDGSHTGAKFSPVIEHVEGTRRVAWCGCRRRHTGNTLFCDGTYKEL